VGVAVCLVVAAAVASGVATAGAASSSAPGVGSAAALSAPNCDKTTERITIPYYAAPNCVTTWKNGGDNGGATAQGVTKDSIKLVVLTADASAAPAGSVVNEGTGQLGSEADAVNDAAAVMANVAQLWGRKVDISFVKASGTDEASQRADALKVIALKPFAVYDFGSIYGGGGGNVFASSIQGKVPVFQSGTSCCGLITPAKRNEPIALNAGEWSGKALVGQPAKWAGDDAMKTTKRVFGVIYPSGDSGIDVSVFDKEFAKYGGKVTSAVSYEPPLDTSQGTAVAQQAAPTLIQKLKAAGVTTIVNFAPGVTYTPVFMKAATDQDYFPEWVVTTSLATDIDVLARTMDPKQMAHAFGLIYWNPWVDGSVDAGRALFTWYWGTGQGTFSAGGLNAMVTFFSGFQLAGPNLTAKSFNDGLVKRFTPAGGAFSNAVTTLEQSYAPPGENTPRGSSLGWFDVNTTAPSQVLGPKAVGAGSFLYLDGGKRYVTGKFPKGLPKFFEPAGAIASLSSAPASEQVPTYPCAGCPATGGAQAPSNTG
jgi:hypothetical protein